MRPWLHHCRRKRTRLWQRRWSSTCKFQTHSTTRLSRTSKPCSQLWASTSVVGRVRRASSCGCCARAKTRRRPPTLQLQRPPLQPQMRPQHRRPPRAERVLLPYLLVSRLSQSIIEELKNGERTELQYVMDSDSVVEPPPSDPRPWSNLIWPGFGTGTGTP